MVITSLQVSVEAFRDDMVASMGATGAVAVGVLLLVVGAARAEGGGMAHLDRVGVRGAAFGGRRLANALNADGNAAKPGGVWQMPVGRLPVDKSVRGRVSASVRCSCTLPSINYVIVVPRGLASWGTLQRD